MSLKYHKPTTSTRRHSIKIDYIKDNIWRGSPFKRLSFGINKTGGRNNSGLITSFHRGGGHKKSYRIIDFFREILDIPGIVYRIEYDPNRSSYIALIIYKTGDIKYILATDGIIVGNILLFTRHGDINIKIGNAMPLNKIPVGNKIHNIETYPYSGGSLVRAAGTFSKLIKIDGEEATIRLKSKKEIVISSNCLASIGIVSKPDHKNLQGGKAGHSRHIGIRPVVRGVAMNPVDHPHGGGEGKTSGGRISVTPWARPTKGYKTKRKQIKK
jgi:large subunit ribosomal protein L2